MKGADSALLGADSATPLISKCPIVKVYIQCPMAVGARHAVPLRYPIDDSKVKVPPRVRGGLGEASGVVDSLQERVRTLEAEQV